MVPCPIIKYRASRMIKVKATPKFIQLAKKAMTTEALQALIDELFEAIIHKLIEENYITFETYFLDGTKFEADASKYSFVWKKSTLKYEETLALHKYCCNFQF